MKKFVVTAALLVCGSTAIAEPAVMLGVSYNFGGATGITLKLLSTNRQDRAALAVGVSFAPGREANRWSWDTGLAYNFKSTSLALSYDWVPGEAQLSFGPANLKAPQSGPVATPAPVVPAPVAPSPVTSSPVT
ncbi:MAG: hypothetical protein MUF44_08895 [Hydrogenophaga sp.]|nr:hypothetical protein [Hydrogenophaga sp.]